MKLDDVKPLVASSSSHLPETQTQQLSFSWGLLAKILATVGTVGGVVMHVIGYVCHATYLRAWGIDPGLFPKSIDDLAITGYYAFMDRSVTFLSLLETQALSLVGYGSVVVAYFFVLFRFARSDKSDKVLHKLRQTPGWVRDLLKSAGIVAAAFTSLPVALMLVIVVLVLPAGCGEAVGKVIAEREQEKFSTGCDSALGKQKCIELHKEGKLIARGFLIDSSTSHIAIFDADSERPRAIERSGTEVLAGKMQKTAR